MRLRLPNVGGAMAIAILLASAVRASDWPTYKRDLHRSSASDESLSFPMRPAWVYVAAQAPRPAWPPPPRLNNVMDFDYAPHPVIAGDIVCFGSTADDTVRALDAATGTLKWRFTTGGPVRFAPQIVDSKVFFASDDGYVYCLEASTGTLVWRFKAAPMDEQYIGNGRMISRWPVRTGVLVENGIVYAVAGVWPSEGIYAYALEAASAKVVWCNDTQSIGGVNASGRWRPHDPHSGEYSYVGLTPQGALLASKDTLVVPLANNSAAAYSKKSGGLVRFTGKGRGSPWITMDGSMAYTHSGFRSGFEVFGTRVKDKGVAGKARMITNKDLPQTSVQASYLENATHETTKVSVLMYGGKTYARKAYGLALAKNVLIAGYDGAVAAIDNATDKEIWRAEVNGEAREIAIAQGAIFVATDKGEISCFRPGTPPSEPIRHQPVAAGPKSGADAPQVVRQVVEAGMDRGFALVVGDPQGELSRELAEGTALDVVNALSDVDAVEALRDKLLKTTALYGSRVHVVRVNDLAHLPFSQFFANAVVVAGAAPGLSIGELFRVLRPCGGIMLFSGLAADQANRLIGQIKAARGEFENRQADGRPYLLRLALPGARDWNANTAGDQRVKWPLRPIWFGGPDSAKVMNVGIGAHAPVAAAGRYFVTGQDSLSAIDAYNGTELWTRPIPSATPNIRKAQGLYYRIIEGMKSSTREQWDQIKRFLAAAGDHVYLRLGEGHFRDEGEAMIKIDARTGEQVAFHGPIVAGPRESLAKPLKWPLNIGLTEGGELSLRHEDKALVAELVTAKPTLTPVDAWDLFFDFRPAGKRCGLYGRGTFMVTISPGAGEGAAPSWTPGTGPAHPRLAVSGKGTATGATTVVRLPWSEVETITGAWPSSFGFAATLTLDAGEKSFVTSRKKPRKAAQVRQQYLFGDALSSSLTSGWATIVLPGAKAAEAGPTSASVDALPEGWPLPGVVKFVYMAEPGGLADAVRLAPRRHPLTGEFGPRVYRSGTAGCGNPIYSAHTLIGRTTKQALGFYDFADDSGLRFFAGISSNCGANMKAINMTAALGLLIFSESRSHCDCMVPIRTSLAFAPAERRLQEDWAIFSERDADTPLRRAALNLTAIGDRRDEEGTLWLATPRVAAGKAYAVEPGSRRYVIDAPPMRSTVGVPFKFERDRKFRAFRFRVNADRVAIEGTDRPWIYCSGLQGIGKMTLALQSHQPLAATPAIGEMAMDGKLLEAGHFEEDTKTPRALSMALTDEGPTLGDEKPDAVLRFTKTHVFLRHDAERLYIGARRRPVVSRTGKALPWAAETKGKDAEVHQDDSWEVFLSDSAGRNVLHLGVSASGARYDALARGAGLEDAGWDGYWQSAAKADDKGLYFEMAVPWQTLAAAGLDKDALAANFQMTQKNISREAPIYPGGRTRVVDRQKGIREPLLSLGPKGRRRCANFLPLGVGKAPTVTPRRFTVRLHFVEIRQEAAAGDRVFDVKLQGETVLTGFDIVKEAGGPRRALVREFKGVEAGAELVLELVPSVIPMTPENAPPICALEVYDEGQQ